MRGRPIKNQERTQEGGGEGSLNIPAIRYSAALEGRYYNRYVGAQVIPRDVSLAEIIELGQREG